MRSRSAGKPIVTQISAVAAIWAVEGALLLGILTVFAFAWRPVLARFADGSKAAVAGALLASLNTASEYGFGGVIALLPGFVLISDALRAIPNPLINEAVSVTVLAGITGSASGGMSIALAAMSDTFIAAADAAKIPLEVLHRVASMASGGMDTLPHNGAVITLLAVTGLTHKEAYKDIFVITLIKTAAVFVVIAFYLSDRDLLMNCRCSKGGCHGHTCISRDQVALKGRRGLIVGIANEKSIAWGCAKAFRALGAELAVTYLNDKAKKYVEPLARELEAPIFMPLDVQHAGPDGGGVRAHRARNGASSILSSTPSRSRPRRRCRPGRRRAARGLSHHHGRVLLVVHPHGASGRAADEERRHAVHHDLLRQPDGREELQHHGRRQGGAGKRGALYRGRARPKGIRVHAISPGPLATRAASGIPEFDELLEKAKAQGAGAQPGQHRRCRRGDRVPGA